MNTTDLYDIQVTVKTEYLAEQSNEELARYAFAYTITITNRGSQTAQLLNRHWLITHGDQKQEEVRGPGVVDEQPVLHPGQNYTYTSGTVLSSPIGSMQGSYEMISEDGHHFEATIPVFTLVKPHFLN